LKYRKIKREQRLQNRSNALCAVEKELLVNGDISPVNKAADALDSMSDNGPKPSAERCRLSEFGDQLHNDVGSPLSATSPVSENGEVDGQCEDCTGVCLTSKFHDTAY